MITADLDKNSPNGIIVRASSDDATKIVEAIIFTGDQMLWFNETTKEIRFKDNSAMKAAFTNVQVIKFYLADEFLFSAFVRVNSPSSEIINSLVFYYNPTENKYYLLDGYPPDNLSQNQPVPPDTSGAREQNMNQIATGWDKFINQLKKDKKHTK